MVYRNDRRSVCLVTVPCGDAYCREDLKALFLKSTKDDTMYPLRCHRNEISLELVDVSFTNDERTTFLNAMVEFSTPIRAYCSDISCNRFINPEFIHGDNAICSNYGTETCVHCKKKSHSGHCPLDPAL